jgi:hypothetical protein
MSSRARVLPPALLCALYAITAIAAFYANSSAAGALAASKRACPPLPGLAIGPAPTRLHTSPPQSEPVIDGDPLLTGLGAVWSASSSGLVELSIPAASAKIVIHEPIDDIALSPSSVFALSRSTSELLQFDPTSLKITRRWHLGVGAWSIVASAQAVYVALATTPVGIDRVNLSTGALTHVTVANAQRLDQQGRSVAYGDEAVWIMADDEVYRLDPTHLSVLGSPTPVGPVSDDLWFGDGSLWTASQDTFGGVDRIDPTNGCVVARAHADAIEIAFAPNAVWLSAAAGPRALNPRTGATIAVIPPDKVLTNDGAGITVVGDAVWTDYGDVRKLQRVQTSGAIKP